MDGAEISGVTFLAVALAAFVVVAGWEAWRPLAPSGPDVSTRWLSNFGLLVSCHAAGYLIVPFAAFVSSAIEPLASMLALTWPAQTLAHATLAAFLLLDLAHWGTHWLMHAWPLLWRVHQVHHCDEAFDVTVGARFHPLEVLINALAAAVLVLLAGLPPLAVGLAGCAIVALNFFSHANALLPPALERALRWALVTPDMHRLHHSSEGQDSRRNYGGALSVWDRLFGTYLESDRSRHPALAIGVQELPGGSGFSVWKLLALPMRRLPAPSARPGA